MATDLANPRQTADTAVGYLTVPAVLVRAVAALWHMVAVYLFMRGHNEPGGGFVAGLVFSGCCCSNTSFQAPWVEAHLALVPRRWIGLACSWPGHGLGPGGLLSVLTSHTAHFHCRGWGEVHRQRLVFDIGVFTLVVGSTLLILTAIAPPIGAQPPIPRAGRRSRGRRS